MGLYDHFECYGHFYKITKSGSVIASCRSQLDIIDSKKMNQSDLTNSKADALAIMMNPGKSKPEDDFYQEMKFDINALILKASEKDLVLTIPDNTQKRLMKIMQREEWKHIKVLNLSDIRQHDSRKLKKELTNYNLIGLDQEHSVFSQSRRLELLETLTSIESKPIILAWGTQTCLESFVITSLKILEGKNLIGCKAKVDGYYHHPLTRKIKWTESFLELLEKS